MNQEYNNDYYIADAFKRIQMKIYHEILSV